MSEATRGYIYRIALGVGALIVGYGLISGDELALWLDVVAGVLLVGPPALATKNTSTS